MDNIFLSAPILWSQIDANNHLRHSAYADFAAQARLEMLNAIGVSSKEFAQYHLGPVLFREELKYLKELRLGNHVRVSVEQTNGAADGSRFSFRHFIYREDDTLCAEINVDGAWIDLNKRKLASIPEDLLHLFSAIPKSDDYQEKFSSRPV